MARNTGNMFMLTSGCGDDGDRDVNASTSSIFRIWSGLLTLRKVEVMRVETSEVIVSPASFEVKSGGLRPRITVQFITGKGWSAVFLRNVPGSRREPSVGSGR